MATKEEVDILASTMKDTDLRDDLYKILKESTITTEGITFVSPSKAWKKLYDYVEKKVENTKHEVRLNILKNVQGALNRWDGKRYDE